MSFPPVILASASPRRRELLAGAGVRFRVEVAGVDELEDGAPPVAVAMANAAAKARAVAARFPEEIVVGADTVVAIGDRLFGKPRDTADAVRMLTDLCGHVHEVTTGVCLVGPGRVLPFHETTRVRFRPVGDVDLAAYLARINPFDKAGGYSAQEDEGELIEQIEGCRDNVVGLPVRRLLVALDSFLNFENFAPL